MPSKDPAVLARAQKKWREKNPDYRENWRIENPEKVAEYNERSLEKRRGKWNAYYWRNRDKLLEQQRVRRSKYPEKAAERQMQAKFGIGLAEKEQMWLAQNKCCKICNASISLFGAHIDHIHDSDPLIIRGLLCVKCNTGLGSFQDSEMLLLAAIAYLRPFHS